LLHVSVERGADPYLAAPKSCNGDRIYNSGCEETTCIMFAGKSALECLWAAKRVIKMLGSQEWSHELSNIERAVEILAGSHTCRRNAKMMPVSEHVVDLWRNILQDSSIADVIIRVGSTSNATASRAEGEILPAHSAVLCSASPVLRSMLSTRMDEASKREICVRDCSYSAVQLLLMILYTGQIGPLETESPSATLLDAVALGHRWLIDHVVDMLDRALSKCLDMQNFEAILDAALRLQLPCILASCRAFVSHHTHELQMRLTRSTGFGIPAVQSEVAHILCLDCKSGFRNSVKRRRTL